MALTEQQKHLLNRLPNWYEVRDHNEDKEPAEVVRARKVIENYTERTAKARKDKEAKFKKAVNSAREAIYFLPAEKALPIVKAFEAEFGMKG